MYFGAFVDEYCFIECTDMEHIKICLTGIKEDIARSLMESNFNLTLFSIYVILTIYCAACHELKKINTEQCQTNYAYQIY
jgi:hypothetical protein